MTKSHRVISKAQISKFKDQRLEGKVQSSKFKDQGVILEVSR